MKTCQICLVVPTSLVHPQPLVEYLVTDEEGTGIAEHGAQLPISPEVVALLSEAKSILDNLALEDCYRRGVIEAPEGWVDPLVPLGEGE